MDKKEKKSSVFGSAMYLTVSAVLVKMIGVMYKVPLSHILTDEGMGYFNAAYTIYSLLYLVGTAGIPKAITVLVSECQAQNKTERAHRLLRFSERVFFFFGLLLSTLTIVFSRPISIWIGSPSAMPTLLLIAPGLIFVTLGGVYRGYLAALGSFAEAAVAAVIEAACKLCLGLLFLFAFTQMNASLPWRCAASVLGIGIGSLISTVYLYFNVKNKIQLEKTGQRMDFGDSFLKRIISIALPITLGSAVGGLSSIIDLSMIMRRLEAGGMSVSEATALYGNYTTLAIPMLSLASSLLAPICVVLLPKLAADYARSDREGFLTDCITGSRLGAFFACPLFVLFSLFSLEALSLLFPYESAVIAAPHLAILSSGVLMLSLLYICNTALEASGGVRLQMVSMLLGVGAKILVSSFLLSSSRFGIAGAPIGTVVSYAVSLLFSCTCLKAKGLLKASLILSCLPSFCLALGSGLFAKMITRFLPHSILSNLFSIALFGGFYLLLSLATGGFQLEFLRNKSKHPKTT